MPVTLLQNYTLFLYNADKSGKVCTVALEAFYLLLDKYSTQVSIQDINLHQFIETICIQTQTSKGSGGEDAVVEGVWNLSNGVRSRLKP